MGKKRYNGEVVTGRTMFNIDIRNEQAVTLANPYGSDSGSLQSVTVRNVSPVPPDQHVKRFRKRYRSSERQDRSGRRGLLNKKGKDN